MQARSAALILILALGCTAGFASTVTINPNAYSNGQAITAPGVTLQTETFKQSGTDSSGNPLYTPIVFGPVYSDNISASCTGSGQCPAVGTSVFAPSKTGALPNTPNFGPGGFWGTQYADDSPLLCSNHCVLDASAAGAVLLRINFAHPTDFVDVLGFINSGDPTEITAFDAAGDLIGKAFNDGGPFTGWSNASITTSTSDISTVLIGGFDSYRGINEFEYSSTAAPEIDTTSAASALTLLLGGLMVLRGRHRPAR